jgi:restriction system protein
MNDMPPFSSTEAQDSPREAYRAQYRAYRVAFHEMLRNSALLDTPEDKAVTLPPDSPQFLLQAVIVPRSKTDEGTLIQAVALPWFDIVAEILKDPNAMYKIPPRKMEEIIAGAYSRQGFEVILTPPSGDCGRDVIAARPGIGSIRFLIK